jgi:hypothetical protein
MITGLNLDEVEDYTLKSDKDKPTVWKLGIIPSTIFAGISSDNTSVMDKSIKLVQIGVKGWENFTINYTTEKGSVGGRQVDMIPMSIIDTIPINVIAELAEKIIQINQLTDDETKN